MRGIFVVISVIITALIYAQQERTVPYSEVIMAKDANGDGVPFRFIAVDGFKNMVGLDSSRMVYIDNSGGHIIDIETMARISDFKPKQGMKLWQVFENGYLLRSQEGRPSFYNFNDRKIWSATYPAELNVRANNIVLCRIDDKTLAGYDAPTGKELWRKVITDKTHNLWCNYLWLDSGKLYLLADSLVCLNLRTGHIKRRKFSAGAPKMNTISFKPELLQNNPTPAIKLERALSAKVDRKFDTGLHSNFAFKGDSLFIADADNLYCYDLELNPIWRTPLPKEMTSKSKIRLSGNKIYLLNFGFVFSNGNKRDRGIPFAAAYNIDDGKQISLTYPQLDKKIVDGFYTDSGRIYWQTNKGFFYCDEGDGAVKKLNWKPMTKFKSDEKNFDYIIYPDVKLVRDGQLDSITTDKNQLVIEVYGKDINVVNTNGECRLIPANEAYFQDFSDNIYSTNRVPDKRTNFVIVNPQTKKLEYFLNVDGSVIQDKDLISVVSSQGIGFRRLTHINK